MQLGRLTLLFTLAFIVIGMSHSCDIIQDKTTERITYCDNHDGTITVTDKWINCQTPEGVWYHCFITINETEIDTGKYNNTFGNDSEGQESNFTTPDGWYSLVLKRVGDINIKNAITTIEVINNTQLSFGFGEDSRFYYTPSITRLKEEFMLGSADVKTNKDLDIEWRMKGKSPDLTIYINGEAWDGSKDVVADTLIFKKGNIVVMSFERPFVMDSAGNFMWLQYTLKILNNQKFIYLTIPKAWLQSAVFPIYIDPTTNITQSRGFIYGDIRVDSYPSEAGSNKDGQLLQSKSSAGNDNAESYIGINYSALTGYINITSAKFFFYVTANGGSGVTFESRYCNDDFINESTMTWNDRLTQVSNCNLTKAVNTSSIPYSLGWQNVELVDWLYDESDKLFVLNLSVVPFNATGLNYATWHSKETGSPTYQPYFEITYDEYGLQFQAYDETTGMALRTNLTLYNSTNTTTFTNQDAKHYLCTTIPTGDVTIIVYNASGGYEPRTYYRDISCSSNTNLTAYLLKNTDGLIRSFFVKDQSQRALSNALVTVDRQIGGVWTRVAEKYTDDAGVSAFLLDPSVLYRISATWMGVTSGYKYITPSESEYTIFLTVTSSSTFQNVFNTVAYSIEPAYLSIPQSNATVITFTVLCTSNDLSNWGMTLTDENYTVIFSQNSTSTNGGQIIATIDTTNLSRVYGTFLINRTGFTPYIQSKNWLVSSFGYGNNSLFAVLTSFKNNNSLSITAKSIIALFVIVGVMAAIYGFVGGLGAGVVGMTMLTIFTAFGWFYLPALIFMWVAVFGYVFLIRGGYG